MSDPLDDSEFSRTEKVHGELDTEGESIAQEVELKKSKIEKGKAEILFKDEEYDAQDKNLPDIEGPGHKMISKSKQSDKILLKDLADLPQNIETVQSISSEKIAITSQKSVTEIPDDFSVLENRVELLSGQARTVAPIRPPPGLSPPPGFFPESNESSQSSENNRKSPSRLFNVSSQTASNIDQVSDIKSSPSKNERNDISEMESAPVSAPTERGADNDIASALRSNDIRMSLLGDDQEPNVITGECLFNQEERRHSIENEQVTSPLLGLGQNINLMDFLSFLDGGENTENTHPSDDNVSSLRYDYGGGPSSLQSNPWRESSQTPRALAYGIEVEQEKLDYTTSEIPLLTPDFLLNNNETPTQHGVEDKADEKYYGDPFLASLLQGDSHDES